MSWQKGPLQGPLLVVSRSLHKDAVKCFKVMQKVMQKSMGGRDRETTPRTLLPSATSLIRMMMKATAVETVATIQSSDVSLGDGWNMFEKTKRLVLKLLDVKFMTAFAIRRVPLFLSYRTSKHRDRLVNGKSLSLFRHSCRPYCKALLQKLKGSGKHQHCSLLEEDLGTASRLIGHYSNTIEKPKSYATIRASINQIKEPRTSTYRLFREFYATRGIKPNQDPTARSHEDTLGRRLAALELHIKRWSKAGDKASHASFELLAVQLLRKGDDADVKDMHAAITQ
ncbi:hypothetical protein FRB90_011270 [Tulasnella sp. 427]|nr:hypothetical protein FRB90_011270 [Tulasnella sp. 427]